MPRQKPAVICPKNTLLAPTPCPHAKAEGQTPPTGRTGVLLVNLGTPTAPTAKALRPYLRQFLSDPRVVELPRLLWLPILYAFVLTFRPAKSAHAYARIWDATRNKSPLAVITEAQTRELARRLGGDVTVRHAMRYGQPSISNALANLKAEGCDRILVAPLYPQYSAATTATVMDEVARWLLTQRWQPALRTLPPYYGHPAYIGALSHSLTLLESAAAPQPDVILASLHGMPVGYCHKGDPYYCHSHKTVRLLAEATHRRFCTTLEELAAAHATRKKGEAAPLLLTFQSQFGKAEWLRPATAEVLKALPEMGMKNVAVLCPGFAADCVETLEEIALAGKETFLEAGGATFSLIPCLNDSPSGMDMLEGLVQTELMGW